MHILRTITVFVALVVAGRSVLADTPQFIQLPYICDTSVAGTFQRVPQNPGAATVAYHQVLNYQAPTPAAFCRNGTISIGPSINHCDGNIMKVYATTTLVRFNIVCRGGVMSAAQATVHEPNLSDDPVALGDWSLRQGVLSFMSRPNVAMPRTRFDIPQGYGSLEAFHPTKPPSSIDTRLLSPEITIIGTPPPQDPEPVRNILFDTAPFAQAALALLAALYASLGFIGRYHNPSGILNPSKATFSLSLVAALAGIYVSAYDPEPAVRDRYREAREMVSLIDSDRAKLASQITVRNGLIEPFTDDAYQSALRLKSPHFIPDTANLQSQTTLRILATLVPLGLFLLLFSPFAMAGWYHLFIRPPIEKTLKPALQSGGPIDTKAVLKDLAPNPAHFDNPPPAYQSLSDSKILSIYITETERQAAELAARAKATEATLNRKQSFLQKFNFSDRLMNAIQSREVNRRKIEALQQQLRETEARLAEQEKSK